MPAPGRELPIAILGAGFSGIGLAIRLEQAGIRSYTIFERADEIGGTWRDNTYPGAACDVPSHVYSLSFEPNPDWSRRYAESGEIQAYLLRLVEKWKLRDRMRLGTAIVAARFDEARGSWSLDTDAGEVHEARVVAACMGGLVDPAWPALEGVDAFAGASWHTARWNHDVPLAGKRVGVIGTGASAVQVVPEVARDAARLSVFQRTPAWVMPKLDRAYAPEERARLARAPWRLRASRLVKYGLSELLGPIVMLDSPRLSAVGERRSLAHLARQVPDPALRAKLRPDFRFGCKRVLISDDYWAAFTRENVSLVTEPVERVVPEGVRTADGATHELDVLVYATGFQVGFRRAPFSIVGRGGVELDAVWSAGATAYKGLSVAGFPNWFTLMGPNTGPGHTSVLVYTEAQMSHVLGAIDAIRRRGLRYVDVRREVQSRYNAGIQARMRHMVWSGCESWYLSDDGTNRSLYPGLAAEYVLRARRFRPRDYECVAA